MKQGIHQLTMQEYLALDALSSGVAHTLLTESPAHARFAQMSERTASKEADIGTYAHAMLLEDGHSGLAIIEADDWRTKAAKESRDEARAQGRLPILARKVPEVEAMVKAARAASRCSFAALVRQSAASTITSASAPPSSSMACAKVPMSASLDDVRSFNCANRA